MDLLRADSERLTRWGQTGPRHTSGASAEMKLGPCWGEVLFAWLMLCIPEELQGDPQLLLKGAGLSCHLHLVCLVPALLEMWAVEETTLCFMNTFDWVSLCNKDSSDRWSF